jgi:hypothetical protein
MYNECLICFEELNRNDKIATCACCKQIVHSTCFAKWREKSETKLEKCIYCQQVDTIIHYTPPSVFKKCYNKIVKLFYN